MPANPIIPGCTGKLQIDTFKRASDRAAKMRKRDGGAHVEAYLCRHCHKFHVGEARSYGRKDKRKEVEV